jgi:hypothetical protein
MGSRVRVIPSEKAYKLDKDLPLKIEKQQRAAALQEIPHPYLASTASPEA